ncbi:putative signal transducing protein [Tenacibaculum agarivorans]|uniref:putative signal transducing protein n=1 Tax=Tenacibaculum agarivorans TaxID=1908389 RepID=UPI00094B92C2|nr:DUF2007 domain-containing protein [Tenacibaculum agarivorans]
MGNFIKIYSGTSILSNRLASLLNDATINTIVKDNQESGRLAGFGTLGKSVDILINDTDLEEAKKIVEEFQKEVSE